MEASEEEFLKDIKEHTSSNLDAQEIKDQLNIIETKHVDLDIIEKVDD